MILWTFTMSIFEAIFGDYLFGTLFLPAKLTIELYTNFLGDYLPVLLELVSLFMGSSQGCYLYNLSTRCEWLEESNNSE